MERGGQARKGSFFPIAPFFFSLPSLPPLNAPLARFPRSLATATTTTEGGPKKEEEKKAPQMSLFQASSKVT